MAYYGGEEINFVPISGEDKAGPLPIGLALSTSEMDFLGCHILLGGVKKSLMDLLRIRSLTLYDRAVIVVAEICPGYWTIRHCRPCVR